VLAWHFGFNSDSLHKGFGEYPVDGKYTEATSKISANSDWLITASHETPYQPPGSWWISEPQKPAPRRLGSSCFIFRSTEVMLLITEHETT